MMSIADSDAFFDSERMLSQHQAALTLLQGWLAPVDVKQFRWLDLACGRGQIIANLKENLSDQARAKIEFHGYDIENVHTRNAEKIAASTEMGGFKFTTGELADFFHNPATNGPWNLVTLTNTIHEIRPSNLASVLTNAFVKLAEDGCLFLYDMEQLPVSELGAVPWTRAEVDTILKTLCGSFGAQDFAPEVGQWRHKTCFGWNAQLRPTDMPLPNGWRSQLKEAAKQTEATIQKVLEQKFVQTVKALEGLTKFGAETDEELAGKDKLLYDFWAVSWALGVKP